MTFPSVALTAISGGINRLRTKGGADKNSLFDLLNGYVTQAGTVKVREGTFRNANIATYSGAGATKGLLAYQDMFHVFSASVVDVPPGYALHVLNHPANETAGAGPVIIPGVFAAATRIGTNPNAGLVSGSAGFAVKAIINPQPVADVGSVSPAQAFGATVEGFFQAIGSSTSDPNELYVVLDSSIAPSGVFLTYTSLGGPVTVELADANITTILGLPAPYVVYALGTTAPAFDPSFIDVSLLLHMDGSNGALVFPDSSVNNFPLTQNGTTHATLETASVKFGSAALFSPQSTNTTVAVNGISTPIAAASALDILSGTADFTIESWFNMPTGSGPCALFSHGDSVATGGANTSGIVLRSVAGAGTGELELQTNIPTWVGVTNALLTIAAETWYHFAVVRVSGHVHLYFNGVDVSGGTFPAWGSYAGPPSGSKLIIGGTAKTSNTNVPNGIRIDEFRISNGIARYTGNFTPTGPFSGSLGFSLTSLAPFPIKEIHFSAPYLGGIYVVAEFTVPADVAAQFGTVFHYWVQSSTGGDNANEWEANTDYKIGDVVIPTSPNGLTFIASRLLPSNPIWTPNTAETIGNIVEPTSPNGFQFEVTAVEGANPTTGVSEPVWPTTDGATVNENSSLASDQTFSLAVAASTPAPSTPARYTGLFSPPGGS